MSIDHSDTSILIALKVDSQDRVDNLDLVFGYLRHHYPEMEIILSEQGSAPHLEGKYDCKYVFTQCEEFFNRQKGVNIAAKHSEKKIIVHYDADIVLTTSQINCSLDAVRAGMEMVLPYDGHFYNIPKEFHSSIKDSMSLSHIDPQKCELFTKQGVGGCVFFDREVFWKNGGANENFKGLGYEDNELFDRFRILGAKAARLNVPLFHLDHVRKETSFNFNPYVEQNKNEYVRICSMDRETLLKEIATWPWRI